MKPFQSLIAVTCLVALVTSSPAHFVWLERTPEGPAAFFGEWSDNLRENQDGYLKIIAGPRALAPDGTPLAVTPKHDRLVLAAAPVGDLRLTAHYRPEKGETFVRYYARHGRSDTSAARLDLEFVPVKPATNTFTLMFKGKPLPEVEVVLFSASGWSRKFHTGKDGRVTVETPWPGQYVIEVGHVEKAAGEHEGRSHQNVRHVSTILFEGSAKS